MIERVKDEARRHNQRITASDVVETATRRIAYKGAENDVTAWSSDEERLIRKLLAALRRQRPKPAHRLFVRLVEDVLDGRVARGEVDWR